MGTVCEYSRGQNGVRKVITVSDTQTNTTSAKTIHLRQQSIPHLCTPAAIRRAAPKAHLRIICGHLRPEPYGRVHKVAADSTMESKSRTVLAAQRDEHPHQRAAVARKNRAPAATPKACRRSRAAGTAAGSRLASLAPRYPHRQLQHPR